MDLVKPAVAVTIGGKIADESGQTEVKSTAVGAHKDELPVLRKKGQTKL